eukprot:Rmarinus@m.29169
MPTAKDSDVEYLLHTFLDKDENAPISMTEFVNGYRDIREMIELLSSPTPKTDVSDSMLLRLRGLLLSVDSTDDIYDTSVVKNHLDAAGFPNIDPHVISMIYDANTCARELSFREFNLRFRLLQSGRIHYEQNRNRAGIVRALDIFEELGPNEERQVTAVAIKTHLHSQANAGEFSALASKLDSSGTQVSFCEFCSAFLEHTSK